MYFVFTNIEKQHVNSLWLTIWSKHFSLKLREKIIKKYNLPVTRSRWTKEKKVRLKGSKEYNFFLNKTKKITRM